MTYIRGIFLFALVMLLVGVFGGRYVVSSMFASPADDWTPIPASTSMAEAASPTASPTAGATPTVTATAAATPTALATATATLLTIVTPIPTLGPSPTPLATATSTPALTAPPTSGTVALSRYWVATASARPGSTVALGYVIDNQTGQTVRVLLGASMKASASLSWAASFADSGHEAVAVVPPGVSTHTRFFTLPLSARAGSYDVAWGLRDATSGQRLALASAAAALSVHK